MKTIKLSLLVVALLATAGAQAQKAGDTIVGVGFAYITSNTGLSTPVTGGAPTSSQLATAFGQVTSGFNSELQGSSAKIKDTSTISISALHMFTDNVGAELTLGVPPKLKVDLTLPNYPGGAKTIGDANSAKSLTPALVGKYLFNSPNDAFRPYLGLGIMHASFTSVKANLGADQLIPPLAGQGVSMSSSWAPVYNMGLIYNINEKWSINGSVSYIPLKSDVTFTGNPYTTIIGGNSVTLGTPVTTATLKINPTDYVIRLGYKF